MQWRAMWLIMSDCAKPPFDSEDCYVAAYNLGLLESKTFSTHPRLFPLPGLGIVASWYWSSFLALKQRTANRQNHLFYFVYTHRVLEFAALREPSYLSPPTSCCLNEGVDPTRVSAAVKGGCSKSHQ
jgi:hypothetical protein